MEIRIFSKEYVENDKSDVSDRYLLSILSTVETPLDENVKQRYKRAYKLVFDDMKYDPNRYDDTKEYHGLQVFDKSHINGCYRLIRIITSDGIDINNAKIDIHCGVGISRSSAVAIGFALILDDKELLHDILKNNSLIKPNPRILSMFYSETNPRECCNMWEIISWYRYKYHNHELSDVPPDTILKEVNLKW